jgi:hypothetical protein
MEITCEIAAKKNAGTRRSAKVCSTKDNRRRASQCNTKANLPGFEIASVFVRLDHIASAIVNANHGLM